MKNFSLVKSVVILINFSNCFVEISANFYTIFWNITFLLTFVITYSLLTPPRSCGGFSLVNSCGQNAGAVTQTRRELFLTISFFDMALLLRKRRERCEKSFSQKLLWPKCFKFCSAVYKLSKHIICKKRSQTFFIFGHSVGDARLTFEVTNLEPNTHKKFNEWGFIFI